MSIQIPRQGEIWRVRFEPAVGSEIRKVRPAVVVSSNEVGRLPLCLAVPITDWDARFENYPWMVQLTPDASNGLTKPSGADAFQVKSLARERFVQKIGAVTREQLRGIIAAIAVCTEVDDEDE
jgi:mRNA interferase MazF